MTNTNNSACAICGRIPATFSPLLGDQLCETCNDWGKANLPVSDRLQQQTTAEEQYAEYLRSFPLNDPRD